MNGDGRDGTGAWPSHSGLFRGEDGQRTRQQYRDQLGDEGAGAVPLADGGHGRQAPAERGVQRFAAHPLRGLVVVAGGVDPLQLLLLLGVERAGPVEVLRFRDRAPGPGG
ncbi:hypothetical protein ACFY15_35465 [Streptomyces sp. NPDC001373]|uniref:hypothetical protein n=1 Tax=Streptomyces sp. NPDC001373 TaxID=3364565 RepID=UPI0036C8F3E6